MFRELQMIGDYWHPRISGLHDYRLTNLMQFCNWPRRDHKREYDIKPCKTDFSFLWLGELFMLRYHFGNE